MEIAEFLLARIAGDEASASDERSRSDSWWSDPDLASAGVRNWLAEWRPSRVLEECEAKRRIVESFLPPDDGVEWALRCLALPYADHPDYDPEWKP